MNHLGLRLKWNPMVQLNQELKLLPENPKQELRPNKPVSLWPKKKNHQPTSHGSRLWINPLHPNQHFPSTNVAANFQEAIHRARKLKATNSSKNFEAQTGASCLILSKPRKHKGRNLKLQLKLPIKLLHHIRARISKANPGPEKRGRNETERWVPLLPCSTEQIIKWGQLHHMVLNLSHMSKDNFLGTQVGFQERGSGGGPGQKNWWRKMQ